MCNNKSISKQKQSKLCSYPVSLSDVLSNRVFLLWPYAQRVPMALASKVQALVLVILALTASLTISTRQ